MGKKACYLIVPVLMLCAVFIHGRIPAKMFDQLGGPPFSDHTGTIEMPGEWRERALKHDEWAKGADMAVTMDVTMDQHLYPALKPLSEQFAAAPKKQIGIRFNTITSWREKSGVDKQAAREPADFLRQKFSTVSAEYGIVPVERLHEAGWLFSAVELVGEPGGSCGKEN